MLAHSAGQRSNKANPSTHWGATPVSALKGPKISKSVRQSKYILECHPVTSLHGLKLCNFISLPRHALDADHALSSSILSCFTGVQANSHQNARKTERERRETERQREADPGREKEGRKNAIMMQRLRSCLPRRVDVLTAGGEKRGRRARVGPKREEKRRKKRRRAEEEGRGGKRGPNPTVFSPPK